MRIDEEFAIRYDILQGAYERARDEASVMAHAIAREVVDTGHVFGGKKSLAVDDYRKKCKERDECWARRTDLVEKHERARKERMVQAMEQLK
jgi:hypothetical protein